MLAGGTSSRDTGLIDEGDHAAGLPQQGPQGPPSLQKTTEGNYLSVLLGGKVTSGSPWPRRSQSNVAGAMGDAVQLWCSALCLAPAAAWPPLRETGHPWVPAHISAAPCREKLQQPHFRTQAEPSPHCPSLQRSSCEPPLHSETQRLMARCTPAKNVHPGRRTSYRHRRSVPVLSPLKSLQPRAPGSLPMGSQCRAGGLDTAPAISLSRQDWLPERAETSWSRLPLPWAARWRWKGNSQGQTPVSRDAVPIRGF